MLTHIHQLLTLSHYSLLFSGSYDRTIKMWSLDDRAYMDTLFGHQVQMRAGGERGGEGRGGQVGGELSEAQFTWTRCLGTRWGSGGQIAEHGLGD